jgi:CRP/FNR family transcriptional regulator, anaerobic regulatory protein
MLNYKLSDSLNTDKRLRDIINCFEKNGQPVQYKKGKVLTNESKKSNELYFVKKGILKSFKWVNDRECVIGFTFSGNFDCNPIALFGNSKNSYTIQAVIDSEIIKFNLEEFMKIYKNNELFYEIANLLLIEYIKTMEIRFFESVSLTAEERYKKLLREHPLQLQEIPLSLIASFLGITNERLSRIRRNIQ